MMNLSATMKVIGSDNTEVPFVFPAFTTSSYVTEGVRFFRVAVVPSTSIFCATLKKARKWIICLFIRKSYITVCRKLDSCQRYTCLQVVSKLFCRPPQTLDFWSADPMMQLLSLHQLVVPRAIIVTIVFTTLP